MYIPSCFPYGTRRQWAYERGRVPLRHRPDPDLPSISKQLHVMPLQIVRQGKIHASVGAHILETHLKQQREATQPSS